MKQTLHFTKMHGAGNDYVYIYTPECPVSDPESVARFVSDRHKGIGSDGLILISEPTDASKADFRMRIFNADGSEALMCGNGSRCVAKYVCDRKLTSKKAIRLETLSGIKTLKVETDGSGQVAAVTVDMGTPRFSEPSQCTCEDGRVEAGGETYRGTFVSMGNPHFVVFCREVEKLDIERIGPLLEHADAFPERCNIEFVEPLSDGRLRCRVWERGSGVTQACGTGSCAVSVAAAREGIAPFRNQVVMDGGVLENEWSAADGHVYMKGPACTVFTGSIDIELP